MKNVFRSILVVGLLASVGYAQPGPHIEPGPVQDIQASADIVEVMIQNPRLSAKLKKEGLTVVYKLTRQGIRPGVTRYTFEAGSCGNCLPKAATVSISEDMRPTYADGSPIYKVVITPK